MALILDGKLLAAKIEQELQPRVTKIVERWRSHPSKDNALRVPTLATILVGSDPASATYVRMKGNACKRVGLESRQLHLPSETSTAELKAVIQSLNSDPSICGILLQHPVPKQIDERACFDEISIEKDVDGVTTHGFGRLAMGEKAYASATPGGIMRLLQHYEIPIAGRLAVVVGRSPILGKPMAAMLLNANATVITCHSKTQDLPALVKQADLIVGAVGIPQYIKSAWIKSGSTVIDAGYHPPGVGDIELDGIKERASAYTPVPGGVGPMTIATLIAQTVEAAENIVV